MVELIFRYRPSSFSGPDRLLMTVYGGSSPLIDCEAHPLQPDEGSGSWVEITSRLPSKAAKTRIVTVATTSPAEALLSQEVIDACTRTVKLWTKSTLGIDLEISAMVATLAAEYKEATE